MDKICDTLGKPLNADVDPNLYVSVFRTSGKTYNRQIDSYTCIHQCRHTLLCYGLRYEICFGSLVFFFQFYSCALKSLLRLVGRGQERNALWGKKETHAEREQECDTKKGIIKRSTWFSNPLLMCRYRTSASYLGENEKVRFH